MYNDIGRKIKLLAKCTFICEAIASVIVAIIMLFGTEEELGIVLLICGPLIAWSSSWVLYGFGELVEKTVIIAHNTKNLSELAYGTRIITNHLQKDSRDTDKNTPQSKSFHLSITNTENTSKDEFKTDSTDLCEIKETDKPQEESSLHISCPKCGQSLDFMGWNEDDLKTVYTCPLCGEIVSFNLEQ